MGKAQDFIFISKFQQRLGIKILGLGFKVRNQFLNLHQRMMLGHRRPEEKMNSFSPWKRKGPEREGGKMMFACSETIIECEDVNGTFINTVLTFATLLRSPIDANAIPDDIKVEVDLYVTNDKPFNALPTAIIRPLDDSISIDPSEISCTRDNEVAYNRFSFIVIQIYLDLSRRYGCRHWPLLW
ncbi:unnamed protein product [Camellia sinensis]